MAGGPVHRIRKLAVAVQIAAACALACVSARAAEPGWRDTYRAAMAARAAHDIAGYHAHLVELQHVLGETAGLSYQLARAEALAGHREAALAHLSDYAASGLVRDVGADSDFVACFADTRFHALVQRVRHNEDPCGGGALVHRFADAGCLTEDLTRDPASGHWFVASVRRGMVLEIGAAGAETPLAGLVPAGWGAFAVRIDAPRRRLWAAVAATATSDGYAAADSDRTALIAWDLASRRVVRRLEPPRDRKRLLGDMTVGPDGAVYVADGTAGALFVARPGADSLVALVPDGVLDSPQTPALAADGRRLYVPEYGRGIAIVDATTGTVSRLTGGPALFLSGIDGLYADGASLIAVQNGARPERIVRLRLAASGSHTLGWDCLVQGTAGLGEPTHAAIVGRDLVYIANSGWDRVGDDQRMQDAPGAAPAELRRIALGPRPLAPVRGGR